jgi:hypothetical protein
MSDTNKQIVIEDKPLNKNIDYSTYKSSQKISHGIYQPITILDQPFPEKVVADELYPPVEEVGEIYHYGDLHRGDYALPWSSNTNDAELTTDWIHNFGTINSYIYKVAQYFVLSPNHVLSAVDVDVVSFTELDAEKEFFRMEIYDSDGLTRGGQYPAPGTLLSSSRYSDPHETQVVSYPHFSKITCFFDEDSIQATSSYRHLFFVLYCSGDKNNNMGIVWGKGRSIYSDPELCYEFVLGQGEEIYGWRRGDDPDYPYFMTAWHWNSRFTTWVRPIIYGY